ncbi:hypothetical protein ACFVMC_11955 [Nocardia sp. NPDC127579]|uniref:hypothetical protein n=1 Tax=Nocardia sp. NPDC127579 TaxID=3345402 RepID=UPI003632263C
MKQHGEPASALRVTVEFRADTSLTVRWAADATDRLEYARIFVVAPGEPERMYLDTIDKNPYATLRLPDSLTAGQYAVEVDAYGSASWGDGRLEARGRSETFPIGDSSRRDLE